MFGWMRRRKQRLEPEARWSVSVGPDHIHVTDDIGETKTLAKADMAGVAIATNDSGPWGADVWWLLFGSDDQLACTFPQGASEEGSALDYLTALPAFDHEQMAKAMGSTANAVFPVWRKDR